MRVGDCRVAHQRVQAPELPQHFGNPSTDLGFVGHIHGHEPGVVAQRFGYLGPAGAVKVGEHHLPAFADQPGGDT
ncbi:hypothetical protein D3C81_2171130 [compost metagenome]